MIKQTTDPAGCKSQKSIERYGHAKFPMKTITDQNGCMSENRNEKQNFWSVMIIHEANDWSW